MPSYLKEGIVVYCGVITSHFIDGFKQQSPAQIHVPGFAVYNGYPPLRESYIYTYIFNIIDKSPLRYIQKQKAFCK